MADKTDKQDARPDARAAARARAAQMQAQADAADRRRRGLIIGLSALVALALVVGIGVLIQRSRATGSASGDADPGYGNQGVIAMPAPAGSKAAAANAVTVRVYGDYMCPACKSLEESANSYLDGLQKAGTVKREFVPVAILNRMSQGTNYSTRAGSAAYCVAKADPSKFDAFTKAMYAGQPAENTSGLTNAQILEVAKKVVPNNATMDACITNANYSNYVDSVTEQASKDGLQSTPTVWINGKSVKPTDADKTWVDTLKREIAAASKA